MEVGGPGVAWSVLAALLLVSSVGLASILKLVATLALTLLAAAITFLLTLFLRARVDEAPLCSRLAAPAPSLQRRPGSVSRPRGSSPVMTGCEALDRPIQDMISFIIRDYVLAWYSGISSNNRFPGENVLQCNIVSISSKHSSLCPDEVRCNLYNVVTLLTERIYVVDWVPYLTTHLVDNIATHVRLFKNARNKYNAPLKDGEARPADLETIFFNYEAEMEGDICRDNVCLNQEGETLYFQELCELLLYLVLPRQEFESGKMVSLS